jgi:phage gp36-like protein
MAYATRDDMITRYGKPEIEGLEADGAKGAGSVDEALNDAAAEADGYVAVRYALPLPGGKEYRSLKWVSCDMARYRLWEGKIKDETDTVYMRYRRAVTFLEALARGDARLVADDGSVPPLSGQGGSIRVLSERGKVFTNDVLRRMDYGGD